MPEPVSEPVPPMSTSDPDSPAPMRIRARGRSFLALVLSPERPLPRWIEALDDQIARSAGFFMGKPVILDLGLLEPDDEGLAGLQEALRERGVRLIGVEGGNPDWPALAGWDWPAAFEGGRASGEVDLPEDGVETPDDAVPPKSARSGAVVYEESVRSGQTVINMEGDLVILGSVASGAEIAAAGSIHVYGNLRGRAVAGIGGAAAARIFVRRMNAELIAIDGYYMMAEEMAADMIGAPVQAMLDDERIVIRKLA